MLFISDFKEKEHVWYRGTKAEITKIVKPDTLCIRNLEFPKNDWITARLSYTEVEKMNS